jgi:hypothetical protein
MASVAKLIRSAVAAVVRRREYIDQLDHELIARAQSAAGLPVIAADDYLIGRKFVDLRRAERGDTNSTRLACAQRAARGP